MVSDGKCNFYLRCQRLIHEYDTSSTEPQRDSNLPVRSKTLFFEEQELDQPYKTFQRTKSEGVGRT